MEKEDEDDIFLMDVYDVIPYYLRQIYIKTPLTMKKLYRAIPSKYRGIAERNRVLVGALGFLIIYFVWFSLFGIFGIISQSLMKFIQFIFGIDRNAIITNCAVFLEGESFLQQYDNLSSIIPKASLTIVLISYPFVLLLFLVYYYVKYVMKKDLHYIGFKNPWKDKRGIALALIFNIFILFFFVIVLSVSKDMAIEHNIILRRIYHSYGIEAFVGILIPSLYYLIGAMMQEVVYRGIVQTALMDKIGTYKGLIITSILFSLSHTNYYNKPMVFLSIFPGSLLLGYLYLRKRNLSSPVILHFLYNFILWSFNR